MAITSNDPRHGFQFPGVFELSAMGAADDDLQTLLPQLLEALGLTVDRSSLRVRPSSKGTYVAVAVSFQANSRADYDAAHAALRARPEIKWTI